MGNCFSDPSKGGQRLGSAPSTSPAGGQTPTGSAAARGSSKKGRTLSGSAPQSTGGGPPPPGSDPRAAALAAAEARAQAANNRGVSAANPSAGKLSSKLKDERRGSNAAQQGKGNERMMDAGQWN